MPVYISCRLFTLLPFIAFSDFEVQYVLAGLCGKGTQSPIANGTSVPAALDSRSQTTTSHLHVGQVGDKPRTSTIAKRLSHPGTTPYFGTWTGGYHHQAKLCAPQEHGVSAQ